MPDAEVTKAAIVSSVIPIVGAMVGVNDSCGVRELQAAEHVDEEVASVESPPVRGFHSLTADRRNGSVTL